MMEVIPETCHTLNMKIWYLRFYIYYTSRSVMYGVYIHLKYITELGILRVFHGFFCRMIFFFVKKVSVVLHYFVCSSNLHFVPRYSCWYFPYWFVPQLYLSFHVHRIVPQCILFVIFVPPDCSSIAFLIFLSLVCSSLVIAVSPPYDCSLIACTVFSPPYYFPVLLLILSFTGLRLDFTSGALYLINCT